MYNLSTTVDPNKIFLIQRSELEERLDSTSYRPGFSFTSAKFRIEKLIKVAQINPKVSFDKLVKESEISFVPMEVINEFNGIISEERFKKVEESKGFTRFTENDLIWAKITPCMQNGKSAVARNLKQGVACGSTEFFVIRPKSNDELLVDYIHFLLRDERVLKDAQNYFGGSAGQQRVSSEFLRNFKIPIPPIVVQHKIVGIINNAYAAKQQKEAEAKALLASIDTYLLGELGISLPEQDNSLEKRIFTSRFSEVGGGRVDPRNILNFKNITSQNSHYPIHPFKDVFIKKPQYGANEEAVDGDENADTRYIRITDIDEWGNLKRDTWKTANKIDPVYLLNENDILIARTGATVGKAFIYKEGNGKAIFAGYMIRFLLNNKLANPDFVFYYLNSSFYKYWISAIQRPSAQPNINSEEYKSLPIPLPPLEKQTEIATYIQNIRSQAKALQHEAARVLEEAKRDVEKMILGE